MCTNHSLPHPQPWSPWTVWTRWSVTFATRTTTACARTNCANVPTIGPTTDAWPQSTRTVSPPRVNVWPEPTNALCLSSDSAADGLHIKKECVLGPCQLRGLGNLNFANFKANCASSNDKDCVFCCPEDGCNKDGAPSQVWLNTYLACLILPLIYTVQFRANWLSWQWDKRLLLSQNQCQSVFLFFSLVQMLLSVFPMIEMQKCENVPNTKPRSKDVHNT